MRGDEEQSDDLGDSWLLGSWIVGFVLLYERGIDYGYCDTQMRVEASLSIPW